MGREVALGGLMLADGDIRASRLVQPFRLTIPNDYSFSIVTPRAIEQRRELSAFREWRLQSRLNDGCEVGKKVDQGVACVPASTIHQRQQQTLVENIQNLSALELGVTSEIGRELGI